MFDALSSPFVSAIIFGMFGIAFTGFIYLAITRGKIFSILLIMAGAIVTIVGVVKYEAEEGIGKGALGAIVLAWVGLMVAVSGIVVLKCKARKS